ncbi:hypothetical protein KP509_1Z120200 [Ceratopteris richardii]|nr:hypothetical protein KP509_1Z120200 [Ceratopteris richardii]
MTKFSVLVLAIAVHALVFLLWKISKRSVDSEEEARFPRGPRGWPIVGNLPLLVSLPHRQLAELYFKKGYRGIIGLRLGTRRAVVVSDAARAREILLTHDKAFANRVPFTFMNEIFYGPERTAQSCTLQLLTTKRLYEMREARYSEGRRLLCRLRDWSGTIVEPGTLIAEMNAAAIARLILSKTLDEVAPDMPQLMRSVQSKATPTIGDFIAYLSFTDAIFKIRMKRLHRRLNAALDSILEERSHLISRLPADQLRDDFLQFQINSLNWSNIGN